MSAAKQAEAFVVFGDRALNIVLGNEHPSDLLRHAQILTESANALVRTIHQCIELGTDDDGAAPDSKHCALVGVEALMSLAQALQFHALQGGRDSTAPPVFRDVPPLASEGGTQ